MNFKPVFFIIGILLSIMAMSMLVPMFADLYLQNDDWKVFFVCIVITAFFGGALILSNNTATLEITARTAFLLIFLSWLTLAGFAALPFALSGLKMSFTDSFFEAMSGITTTGSTVITGLDTAPPGILLWRSILQWLGGIGIILMAMSILPFLNVGGMQIFRTELSEDEKVLPRTAQLASSIGFIYMILTLICIFCYMAVGLSSFDALTHAMTTISTGGFSTYDASFMHFESIGPSIVATVFMVMGGLPFVLYLKAVRGDLRPLFQDKQVHWYLIVLAATTIGLSLYLYYHDHHSLGESFLLSSFNIASIMTGTGYANADYEQWGIFAATLFFFLMLIGGCAGSTSCSIKIFRYQVLFAATSVQIRRLLYPHGVFIPHYNGKPLAPDVPLSVMSFFFMYGLCCAGVTMALTLVGLDFLEAVSGAVTAVSNVGPGLGEIGPAGNFQGLSDAAKWILSIGMLIGRLEIFAFLVMLSSHFWKR